MAYVKSAAARGCEPDGGTAGVTRSRWAHGEHTCSKPACASGPPDEERGCDHVNLIEKTHVPGESEFLFSAYAAFRVDRVHWSEHPENEATPHEITLFALPDNKAEPEDLALAPWC